MSPTTKANHTVLYISESLGPDVGGGIVPKYVAEYAPVMELAMPTRRDTFSLFS